MTAWPMVFPWVLTCRVWRAGFSALSKGHENVDVSPLQEANFDTGMAFSGNDNKIMSTTNTVLAPSPDVVLPIATKIPLHTGSSKIFPLFIVEPLLYYIPAIYQTMPLAS